jgi:hypothetical protein
MGRDRDRVGAACAVECAGIAIELGLSEEMGGLATVAGSALIGALTSIGANDVTSPFTWSGALEAGATGALGGAFLAGWGLAASKAGASLARTAIFAAAIGVVVNESGYLVTQELGGGTVIPWGIEETALLGAVGAFPLDLSTFLGKDG